VVPPVFEKTPALLYAALHEVRLAYRDLNTIHFEGQLRPPVLEWSGREAELGAWLPGERVLRLSVRLLDRPWGVLVEVLKHEMAHQYVHEVIGVRTERAHGPMFQKVCEQHGIDARAAGLPEAADAPHGPEGETRRRIERVEKLLALAASDNQHEAELAMATARRLMLRYNLEAAAAPGAALSGRYTFRHLGRPTTRRYAWQRALIHVISEYFFVELIIIPIYRPEVGKRATILEACGTRENLDIASYAYDFLERTAETLWKKHKREQGLRGDRARQSYLYGVLCGFSEKLESEVKQSREQGLVWLGDPALSQYFRRRHPYLRSVAGRGLGPSEAFSAGHRAGTGIVLHRGVEAGQNTSGPRLLGGRTER
jgi:hypothetical protein